MKTLQILIVLAILLSGCTSEILQKVEQKKFEQQKTKTAVIAGKISNLNVYPHIRELKLTVPGFRGDEQVITFALDTTGQFRFEFYPVVLREVNISNIEDRIIIGPGDSLYIKKDFADIINTDFSGDNSQVNKEISLFRSEYLGRYSHGYNLSYPLHKAFCDSMKQIYIKRLTKFEEKYKTSKAFKKWVNKQIELDYFDAMLKYPYHYWVRSKEEMKDSTTYFSFTKDFSGTFDNDLIMTDYFKVAEKYAISQIKNVVKSGMKNKEFDDNIFAAFTSTSTEERYLNEFLLCYFIHTTLNSNTTFFVDKYPDKIESMISDNFLKYSIMDRYERTQEYLKHPEKFTETVLGSGDDIEVSGKSIDIKDSENNIVRRLINKYPGKVIYFDVWSSGCAPCVHNMKYSKELEIQYRGKDIVFAYLSTDTKEDKWQSRVKELRLEGVHILCSREESRDLHERFGFSGIPYYFLVNKKGSIVDFGNHLIPQSKSTQEEIRNLVEEKI